MWPEEGDFPENLHRVVYVIINKLSFESCMCLNPWFISRETHRERTERLRVGAETVLLTASARSNRTSCAGGGGGGGGGGLAGDLRFSPSSNGGQGMGLEHEPDASDTCISGMSFPVSVYPSPVYWNRGI